MHDNDVHEKIRHLPNFGIRDRCMLDDVSWSFYVYFIYRRFFPNHLLFFNCQSSQMEMKVHFAINAFRVESETLFSCHTATVYTCRTTRGDWFKSAINKIGDRNSVGNIQWVKAQRLKFSDRSERPFALNESIYEFIKTRPSIHSFNLSARCQHICKLALK